MNDLVIMENHQAVTTSLKVATAFGKEHKNVIQAIESKIYSAENSAQYDKMFLEGSYKDRSGKSNKMYYMNRDGFSFIAFGFTGKRADEFKLQYIEAFNQMEAKIKVESKAMSLPERIQTIALGYTELETDVKDLKLGLSDVTDRMGLPGNMKKSFSKARNRKVIELMGGSKSNAYLDKGVRQRVYSQMFASFKEQFATDSYADCPMKSFDDAIQFVNNWFAPYELQKKIQLLNSQTNLFDGKE